MLTTCFNKTASSGLIGRIRTTHVARPLGPYSPQQWASMSCLALLIMRYQLRAITPRHTTDGGSDQSAERSKAVGTGQVDDSTATRVTEHCHSMRRSWRKRSSRRDHPAVLRGGPGPLRK